MSNNRGSTIAMLVDKIKNRESGVVLYGITPPKQSTDVEKVAEIAALQKARLQSLDLDGLILYDIQDEKTRTDEERPFPFMATLDGFAYSEQYLQDLQVAKIIYRAVGKHDKTGLSQFLNSADAQNYLTVFVGAASKDQAVSMSLDAAYQLKQEINPQMLLGGVTIPERHQAKGDEHRRVLHKIAQGCRFFVSQGVYDVNASRNFLSDYYYHAQENGIDMVPILFTLTPCGSARTLQFMKWLGISIPRWLENDLLHSKDILEKSVAVSAQNWRELKEFADEKNIPIGCNIESVAIRKVEVEASIELLDRVRQTL